MSEPSVTHRIGIDLKDSALTLDAGFDSRANKEIIKAHHMKPVIYPNRRNTKTPIVLGCSAGLIAASIDSATK